MGKYVKKGMYVCMWGSVWEDEGVCEGEPVGVWVRVREGASVCHGGCVCMCWRLYMSAG